MFDIGVKLCMISPDALCKTPTRSRDRASSGKGALMPSAKPRQKPGSCVIGQKDSAYEVKRVPFDVFLIKFFTHVELIIPYWSYLPPFGVFLINFFTEELVLLFCLLPLLLL
jgi:hypothetical protein